MPISVLTSGNLTRSLTLLGKFGEAAACEVDNPVRGDDAARVHHRVRHYGATLLYLTKGDWEMAHSRVERWLALHRPANAIVP